MTIADAGPTTMNTTGELESIAAMLAARYPDLARAAVDDSVRTTYDRLDSTARLRGHLFPLTANRAQVLLERLSAEMGRTLPQLTGRSR
jgi:pimeloyl-ACP methyl ester carboxylesterase